MVSGNKLLLQANANQRPIPAFNIYNLETIRAALMASAYACQPVILAFGAGYLAHASFRVIHSLVNTLAFAHTQDVVLHLDHCRDLVLIQEALDAGFTSVMYDGSRLPFAENIRLTTKAVRLATHYHANVEAELGSLNDETGETAPDTVSYTNALQARHFVHATGISSLAVSIGNAHGLYSGKPHLNIKQLQDIHAKTQIPLVLHGSTGISLDLLAQAAAHGIAKININTDIAMAGAQAALAALQTPEGARLEHVMLAVQEQMCHVMQRYFMPAFHSG